ncbi:MAG: hypothetical protein AAGB12_08920 [Pseudomonadota bacterium]
MAKESEAMIIEEITINEKAIKSYPHMNSMHRIRWLKHDSFWHHYKNDYRAQFRRLNKRIYLKCAMELVREVVATESIYSTCIDESEGYEERWYGIIDNHLFTLTCCTYAQENFNVVDCENSGDIVTLIKNAFENALCQAYQYRLRAS